MAQISLDLPTLFGDHHVIEVRRILLALPGVQEVYASSALRRVEVAYDPALTGAPQVQAALEAAGYLGDWAPPVEYEPAAAAGAAFRHTAVYETTRQVVSFARPVQNTDRPLWPCPGLGPIRNDTQEA